jgi:two-component system, OmpR family, response regulator QseB
VRVLVVEDDRDVSDAIRNALILESHHADVVRDGSQALTALDGDHFDLMILDLGLPEVSGLEVLRQVRARGGSIPILILTARDLTADRVAGLDAGADDYLTKPFDIQELAARLRALSRRARGRATAVLHCRGVSVDPAARAVTLNGTLVDVSRTEYAILLQLIENAGRVVKREDLISNLYGWGTDSIDSNAIDVHVSHLRRKLGKDFIRTLRGVGYIVDLQ